MIVVRGVDKENCLMRRETMLKGLRKKQRKIVRKQPRKGRCVGYKTETTLENCRESSKCLQGSPGFELEQVEGDSMQTTDQDLGAMTSEQPCGTAPN